MNTYRIIDGVRRAKLAYGAGWTDIRAEIIDQAGHVADIRPIPLTQLLSTKSILDLRNDVREKIKFLRLQSYFLAGFTLPSIVVIPDTHGILLANVQVLL